MISNSIILKKQGSNLLIGIKARSGQQVFFSQTKQSLFTKEQVEIFIEELNRTHSRIEQAVIQFHREVIVSIDIPLKLEGNKGVDIVGNLLIEFLTDLSQGNKNPEIKNILKDITDKMVLFLKKDITL